MPAQVKNVASKPKRVEIAGITFVQVPAGQFIMGEPEREVGKVTMSAFWISEAEITNTQFERFRNHERTSVNPDDDMPVTNVTRQEIYEYLSWLKLSTKVSFDLPTSAQWEYAARGGLEQKNFPWGDRFDERLALIGSGKESLIVRAASVKSYPPNGFGLYDLCGNVGEYVREYYDSEHTGGMVNPIGRLAPSDAQDDFVEVRGIGVGAIWPWIWMRTPDSGKVRSETTGFRVVLMEGPLEVPSKKTLR